MEMAKHPLLRNRDIPFIVLANKQDLPGRVQEEDLKKIIQVDLLKSVSSMKFYVKDTIGIEGQNINECFQVFEGRN